MRVILAGQRSFGAAVFDMLLHEGHSVAAIWSPWSPDNYDRATDKLTRAALGVGNWVPPHERTPKVVQQLEVDLFVAAHSHDFIGRESRAATRLGGVGYHPSLLPRHRGRDAVRWTIHLGDPVAGGSVYWLTDNVDGGPIAKQDWCFVDRRWDHSDLWRKRLFPMGIRLLQDTLRDLTNSVLIQEPQDESFATWEPSWDRPPLHRPELPQIGSPKGFDVRTHRGAAR
jgi:methionyl-tRNA formyltransferase